MNSWQLAIQSFKHYLSVNLAIALGVAAATAVLTGALLVGESMRTSLRELTLDRLGETDQLLVSQGFFDPASLDFKDATTDSQLIPAILFNNGTVETESSTDRQINRASNVNVFGIKKDFWTLDSSGLDVQPLTGEAVIINQALADQLGIDRDPTATTLTLRIPKPTQLPAESALGATRDLIESLVGLKVIQVLPSQGIAGFSLHPSQLDSPNIFVPIELLQDSLSRKALRHKSSSNQANVAFLKNSNLSLREILDQSQRSIEDEGLILKRVSQNFGQGEAAASIYDYWSLSSEQLVLRDSVLQAVAEAYPDAKPVFTYLANDIRKADAKSGVPFSMVAAIDFDKQFQLLDADSKVIPPLKDNEIVLNQWAADNIGVAAGDDLVVTWFDPETTHGKQTEQQASFVVAAVAALTEPIEPFEFRRGGKFVPPKFQQAPTLANDANLTPEVPGVTDAKSIENWDLPFETASKLRPEDDYYWDYHRTTPKAFVSLAAGQRLWSSRFGRVTSLRIPIGQSEAEISERLLDAVANDKDASAFTLVPLRENLLAASSGSTPFDALFLALSMFVIASGLILVSLLFRLALQSRVTQVGVLRAVGLPAKTVSGVWLREMALVCVLGALIGIAIGIGYAAAMIWGLKTWWLGAISKPIINLHIGPISIVAGFVGGILTCVATILWVLRSLRTQTPSTLLAGQIQDSAKGSQPRKRGRRRNIFAGVLLVMAILLSVVAIGLSGDAQAGSFMASGFCVLLALLLMVFSWLSRDDAKQSVTAGLGQLSLASLQRNPLRSTLTIGLVAVASFLITAVSSFRLTPTEEGTAGFDYVAVSSQPIFADLGHEDGQRELLGEPLTGVNRLFGFRYKPGEDASCNNLYQSTQPRVLGVPQNFIESFDGDVQSFAWGGTIAESGAEVKNPWRLLEQEYGDGVVPVLIDKNTANYSLKIFAPGGDYVVRFDSGEKVTFRVVGFLSNTILQGSLLISEKHFVNTFPYLGGSRYFLIDDQDGGDQAIGVLESQLGDEGFDARSATDLLAGFMSVQNTYLSTFQSLGALGLLLGTFGLAAVQIRNVLERKRELGLMRAVGFPKGRLSRMILIENSWVLGGGLLVGVLSAFCGTLPHYVFGDASVPWLALIAIFLAIFVIGLLASFLATRVLSGINLLDSLRQ